MNFPLPAPNVSQQWHAYPNCNTSTRIEVISAITSYEDFTRFIGDIVQRIDRAPADADRTPTDRFEIEIRTFRKTLGRIIVAGLRAYGINLPESRADADRMVTALLDGKPLK